MTYGTLAIELAVGVLVWNRRLRPWVLVHPVGLHLAIDYSIRVGFLSFVAITALTSFISPDASAKAILTARDLLATTRRRQRPASPVSARSASADALRTGSTR